MKIYLKKGGARMKKKHIMNEKILKQRREEKE